MSTKVFLEQSVNEIFKVRQLDPFMSNHSGFIAGGVFKNIFEGKRIKDVDLFFMSMNDFKTAVDHYVKSKEFEQVYDHKNAIGFLHTESKIVLDLVRSTFGTPEEIISNFDFTVTKFAYFKKDVGQSLEYTCLIHQQFFEHLMTKKLVIDAGLVFPIGTFERSYRYKGYGFGLCRGSKEKLIQALQGAQTDNLTKDLYHGFD